MLSHILSLLSDHPWCRQIHYLPSVDSTNTFAKQLAFQGAPEGTVVIAGQQTGGRGRMGRSFCSPAGMGIYMSVILRPNCPPEELMHLTCAAAVAACNAIGPLPRIKWTNDLVINRKKLGGILTELSVDPSSGMVQWAIIGIGINCCLQSWQFPPELRDIACSLEMDPQKMPDLIAGLIRELYSMRATLFTEKAQIMKNYCDKCVTIGQEISVVRGDTVQHALAIGVDENGGLQVRYSDDSAAIVTSGEVSIRGMYGYV